jgi:hypothetical protein
MCDLARTHWSMQVKVFFEVATLVISTPLAVTLDGGATVFPTSTAVDFLPEVHRLVASHRARGAAPAGAHLATPGAPTQGMAPTPLTKSATAAQRASAASHGVAC